MSTSIAKKNCFFGRKIRSISTLDIALYVKFLIILFIPTPVLPEVELLLTLTMLLCATKMWSENERGQSSTWRELSVIEFSLQSFASLLEGSHVKWFTDSQVAAKIAEVNWACIKWPEGFLIFVSDREFI